MIVRPATPADFDPIAELTVAAYRGDGQTWPGHAYEPTLRDVAARAVAGDLLVCADESGSVLGAVLFAVPGSEFSELAVDGEAEFRMLAVAPSAQGKGVGRKLAQACLDRARELGCKAVVICVRDFSKDAQRLYDRMGFVREPRLDWSPMENVRLLGLRYDF
ncbi:N-acetyltransferase [Rhizocola hellebori]|uniref:N-acetyltransferase n=1 Tax=Rhizocola hellebori TaxID=1392758 RepID=A0A8J3QLG3_9ACTN|nr:GNAT family N-acetyltransferase [Rhizocola hellebori]GIH11241.1 N-acetyltransferase [Rhizocola hellebori]